MENYKIYCHTTPSGKKYIGITKQDLTHRFGKSGEKYKRCTAFWKAIEKYGWNNIKHEVIDNAFSLEEANEKEKFYIKLYKTNDKNYGYNCTIGGDGVSGWKPTEEQRIKNSNSKKEMWKNPQIRKRLTDERKARGNSKQEKERLLKMCKSNWENPLIRSELEKHLSKISNDEVCKEKRKKSMKKIWQENPEKFMKNRKYKRGEEHFASKKILCVETNTIYVSGVDAMNKTGISNKAISAVLNGKRKTAGDFHWEFV